MLTRRKFMEQVAWAGLPVLAGCATTPPQPANSRLQHAAVGVNGRGRAVLMGLAATRTVDVVALCDVDATALEAAQQAFPQARPYSDWREMLLAEGSRIDSVSVATPDHSHAPAALAAIQQGKHVFCEKPLAHTVYETRCLTDAARKAGVATQMGIQMHAHSAYQGAMQMLRDGAIGAIREWHSWCKARYGSPGMKRPAGEDAVPAHLDWDLWIGVAPMRPFKEDAYHPGRWRAWRDFGCGALGDFGCHIFDPVFAALALGPPLSVQAETPETDHEVWPEWSVVRYAFDGGDRADGPLIHATWYDGGRKPDPEALALGDDVHLPEDGSLIIGSEGTMLLPHCAEAQLYPAARFRHYPRPEPERLHHLRQWTDACRGQGMAHAHFDYAGPLTEAVLLGTIAQTCPGKTLHWNAADMTVTNAPEADNCIRRPWREGWRV